MNVEASGRGSFAAEQEEEESMFTRIRRYAALGLVMIAAVSIFAVACGDDDDDGDDNGEPTTQATTATTPEGEETPAGAGIDVSGVPELSDGTWTIGSDIAYAPIEFEDENGEPVGLDIDLANALAELMGVEVVFENAAFDGLIPALLAERYDTLLSAMTIKPERDEQVDFVPYFNAGSGLIVAAGNPNGIQTPADLCGRTVAVQEGTIQVELLETQSGECDEAINILRFPTDPEAVQALIAGQADAEIADFPVAAYSATQSDGALEVIPNQIDPAPYGIAVRPDSDELEQVLQDALDQLIEDGTYDDILDEWNLAAGAIE
jgi:polar amino acid transport system substrate-binding protein